MRNMMKYIMTAVTSMALSPAGQIKAAPGPSLEKSLRIYRASQAYIRAVPVTAVFGDKIIQAIVNKKPATPKGLMSLQGMGAKRLECYGADILRIVNLHKKKKTKVKAPVSANAKPKISITPNAKSIKVPKTRPKPRPRPKPKPKPNPKPNPKPFCTLPGSPSTLATHPEPISAPPPSHDTSVYILELEDNRVYIGSSRDVPRRIKEHAAGKGSAFTRAFKPTGIQLPRLGNVSGDGDAAERDETLRYMMLRGIHSVRGWRYSRVDMQQPEFDDAEANIRELYDLCRRCGFPGHFVSNCRMVVDRWGKPCKCTKVVY